MFQPNKNSIILRSYLWGAAGSFLLLGLYFLILTLSNSFSHAVDELRSIGLWVGLLAGGFGVQTGLFVYVRRSLKARATAQATASMAAAGVCRPRQWSHVVCTI